MNKEVRKYVLFKRKLATIECAEECGNIAKACRIFGFSRAAFYRWKKIYDVEGEVGLWQR